MELPVVATPAVAASPSQRLAATRSGALLLPTQSRSHKTLWTILFIAASAIVLSVLVWQGLTAAGSPDPTADGLHHTAVVMDTGVLVFREGLEAILVLAALTASLVRTEEKYWKPVAIGAGLSFMATVATWFIVVGVLATLDATLNIPALKIQAATGLLAIGVLLVIMNWFFHKVYWTGWITHHNRRKRALTENPGHARQVIFRGLILIGFTSIYREGFEIVLFLQSYRLKFGTATVMQGVSIGLFLVILVAMLTFVAHYRLPYKRMLVLTGVMLGAVLIVMVGENIQEMQQAHWMTQHDLNVQFPDWLGTWFAIFNNWETIAAQLFAIVFVVGSYFLARRVCNNRSVSDTRPAEACILPDCNDCDLPHAHNASN